MKTFYGDIYIGGEQLVEFGLSNPIKIEYYKTKKSMTGLKLNRPIDLYGIEIVKSEYLKDEVVVETEKIDFIATTENLANEVLEMLKENQVMPTTLKEIVYDLLTSPQMLAR